MINYRKTCATIEVVLILPTNVVNLINQNVYYKYALAAKYNYLFPEISRLT